MPGDAVYAVAYQRVERRADRQRQAVPEGEVGQRQPHHRVDGPGVHAPVEQGDAHRLARGFGGGRVAHRRVAEMHHRLGDAEEHQADAHAGRKQHREPGPVAVVGPAVVGPEPDAAITGHRHAHHEDQETRHRQHVEPARLGDDPGLDGRELFFRRLGPQGRQGHEQHDDGTGGDEHRRVHHDAPARRGFRGVLVHACVSWVGGAAAQK